MYMQSHTTLKCCLYFWLATLIVLFDYRYVSLSTGFIYHLRVISTHAYVCVRLCNT